MSKKTADRQAKIYFQIGRVLDSQHATFPDNVYNEYEDYRSEFSMYDVWSENPATYEDENGFRPAVPLDSERRRFYKEHGFQFKQDGTVLYEGVPCDEWVTAKEVQA